MRQLWADQAFEERQLGDERYNIFSDCPLVNNQPSTLNPQPCTLNPAPSNLHPQT